MTSTAPICPSLFRPEARLSTFVRWPHTSENLSPTVLANNGFFFTGVESDDEVQCFACAKVLDGWEADDSVLEEHKRRNFCPYVQFLESGGDPKDLPLKLALKIMIDIYKRRQDFILLSSMEEYEIRTAFKNRRLRKAQ